MNLILLGGNDPINKDWTLEVEEKLSPLFERTHTQIYKHWQDPSLSLDFEGELQTLIDKAEVFDGTPYVIFAKSVGTLLTFKAVSEGRLKPRQVIMTGTAIPFGRAQGWDVDDWMKGYNVPTLFIQQTADPAMGFADLKAMLQASPIPNYEVKEVEGNDHAYLNTDQIHDLVEDFLFENEN